MVLHLKIDYNKNDGYYSCNHSQLGVMSPSHFFRKVPNLPERFGTEELARIEGEMLEA